MSGHELALTLIGAVTVAAALAAVTTTRLVRAALWLITAALGMACTYLLLGAEFNALVQVLVYVGAVVVLLVVALMLTRSPTSNNTPLNTAGRQRAVAAVAGAGIAVLLASALIASAGGWRARVDPQPVATPELATELFSTWVIPFEALSLLLLIALIAALTLAAHSRAASRRER